MCVVEIAFSACRHSPGETGRMSDTTTWRKVIRPPAVRKCLTNSRTYFMFVVRETGMRMLSYRL